MADSKDKYNEVLVISTYATLFIISHGPRVILMEYLQDLSVVHFINVVLHLLHRNWQQFDTFEVRKLKNAAANNDKHTTKP